MNTYKVHMPTNRVHLTTNKVHLITKQEVTMTRQPAVRKNSTTAAVPTKGQGFYTWTIYMPDRCVREAEGKENQVCGLRRGLMN